MFKQITVEKVINTENSYHAARVRSLGITAYGNSPEEALEKLKEMFSIMIDINIREHGEEK